MLSTSSAPLSIKSPYRNPIKCPRARDAFHGDFRRWEKEARGPLILSLRKQSNDVPRPVTGSRCPTRAPSSFSRAELERAVRFPPNSKRIFNILLVIFLFFSIENNQIRRYNCECNCRFSSKERFNSGSKSRRRIGK